MKRAVILVALLPLAGCGGGSSGDLRATQDRLSSIRAATLDLRLLVTPKSAGASQPFGFELSGPFDLRSGGSMPKLHVGYTQIANGTTATATVVSDGHRATVRSGGKTVTLSGDAARRLNVLGGSFSKDSLDLTSWVRHPHESAGQDGTERIDGDLDVARALRYFAGLSGTPPPELTKDERKRLQDAVDSARIEVVTGAKDKLLRRLHFVVELGFDVPPDLRAALGSLVGAKLELQLKLANPQTT